MVADLGKVFNKISKWMDVILCKTVGKTAKAKHSIETKSTLNEGHYCCWGKSHDTTAPLTSRKTLMDQGLK